MCFEYYAGLIRDRRGRVIPSAEPGQLNLVIKEPIGVVGCIVPFNYPLMLLAWKVAPALAAGNTVVIKPASQTPLLTLDLHRVFDHLPQGVVNIITGSGSEVGDALVKHPDVPCIAFTGSTAVGRHIYRLGAERIKKLHLELGGSDAAIVCADCDPEAAGRAGACRRGGGRRRRGGGRGGGGPGGGGGGPGRGPAGRRSIRRGGSTSR